MSDRITGIQIGDNHADEVNPASRIDNYNEAFFKKLEEIKWLVEKHHIDFSLWTADWFHKKDPWRVSHRLVNRMRDILASFPSYHQKFSLVGNHDITADNIETLNKQPLWSLFSSEALTWLSPQDRVIERGKLRVQISGADYSPFLDSKDKSGYDMVRQPDIDYAIKLVHGFLLKPSEEWYVKGVEEGFTRMNDISNYSFDALFHGHRHDDVGVTTVGGKEFINFGSMMRGSIAEMNIKRHPKVGMFSVEKVDGRTNFVVADLALSSAAPADKIFDLAALAEQKDKDEVVKQFVDKLGQEVGAVSEFDLFSLIDKLEVFAEIPMKYKDRAKRYLEMAQRA